MTVRAPWATFPAFYGSLIRYKTLLTAQDEDEEESRVLYKGHPAGKGYGREFEFGQWPDRSMMLNLPQDTRPDAHMFGDRLLHGLHVNSVCVCVCGVYCAYNLSRLWLLDPSAG